MASAHSETPELVLAMLGAILRRRREESGRTLAEAAEAAGISPGFLSEVERGRKEMSIERLAKVATTLGVAVATIYRELAAGLDGMEMAGLPADPHQQLRLAATVLDPVALRTVAEFSSYLLMRQAVPQQRRIGFQAPGR
ncbi:MAG: helix-turn-helix transcriptional regulator [Chloroflexi bacterium]|nr:MAG: helix-turn-helix transcriptional regulator [Chloroflexota bacterium]TME15969.1 MAG: helix-turn-helix transcriptional regulator [Chloroflexota bacterium]TME18778.1 MAG: helix-turn-helix transcriptional regulator [Chloroflexota bacterium]